MARMPLAARTLAALCHQCTGLDVACCLTHSRNPCLGAQTRAPDSDSGSSAQCCCTVAIPFHPGIAPTSSMCWSCRGAAYQKWIALCSVQAVGGSTAGGGRYIHSVYHIFSSEGGDISLPHTKVGAKGAGAKDGAKGIRAGVLLTKVIAYVVCSAWFAATLPNTVVPRTAVSPVLRAFSRKIWQEIAQHTVENIATRKHLAGVGDRSLDIVCGIGHPSVYLVDCGHEVVVLEVCHELMEEPIMERDDCKITCGYLLVKAMLEMLESAQHSNCFDTFHFIRGQ
ncbi:hypothetical protein B0H14DRAFT_2633301 [Mycena olivaceomarginata]|nr:hypothetical protein B0H14DRAFT_2633301 [Mycena olivaceomarginata]